MEMTNDDLLDVVYRVASCFNSGTKFMLGLVFGTTENIGYLLAPNYIGISICFERSLNASRMPIPSG